MTNIIIVHNLKHNYTVSYSAMLTFNMFYKMRNLFGSCGYNIISVIDFIKNNNDKKNIMENNFGLSDEEIDKIFNEACKNLLLEVKNTDKFDNAYIICFTLKAGKLYVNENIKILKSKHIKTLFWDDDIHTINRIKNVPDNIALQDERYDNVDLIITPGRYYFENVNSIYLSKTLQYSFFIDEVLLNKIPYDDFKKRKNKILISGVMAPQYPVRNKIYAYHRECAYKKDNDGLMQYLDLLPHPGYDRHKNQPWVGENYYKILASYKGAFCGFHKFPLNCVHSKFLEILACGTLGFFEDSDILERDYGLVRFKHYVPILLDEYGNVVFDEEYYGSYLESNEGEKIAKEGCEYIRGKFNMGKQCDLLMRILDGRQLD
jgi:hypothetical protein